jgi:protein-tyrosine phosphatase
MLAIDVDGLFNVRASDTRRPWLVRSGAPEALSEAGEKLLIALGVSVIVDLREPAESEAVVHGIPLASVPVYGTEPPATGTLEEIYEGLLRSRGHALTAAVGAIADAEGAALVHCTAGKDRTGLVVALARFAAGASEDDVVADYVLSAPQVRPVRGEHAERIAASVEARERADVLRLHLESPPEAIVHALAVIREFGGAEEYLRAHGLRSDQLAALRRKEGVSG